MRQLSFGYSIMVLTLVGIGCGGGSLQPGINGCTSYIDGTSPGASRTINFGASYGNSYNPKCLAIAPGQSVIFSGDFSAHPMQPGLAPSQRGGPDAGSPNNPIRSTTTGGGAQFTFPIPGVYPYYCSVHEAQGMFGAVEVLGP